MEEELDPEPPWRGREGVGEDEVRVAVERLPEGGARVQGRRAERGRERPGGALRRREVAEGRGRAAGEEVDVRERDDEEDERGDGRREETPHRKIGSFRQPHFWSL